MKNIECNKISEIFEYNLQCNYSIKGVILPVLYVLLEATDNNVEKKEVIMSEDTPNPVNQVWSLPEHQWKTEKTQSADESPSQITMHL